MKFFKLLNLSFIIPIYRKVKCFVCCVFFLFVFDKLADRIVFLRTRLTAVLIITAVGILQYSLCGVFLGTALSVFIVIAYGLWSCMYLPCSGNNLTINLWSR